MQIVIEIPDALMKDYQDLFYKIQRMAASEGLFGNKKPNEKAKALGVILKILIGITNGTPLPKGHGRLIDADELYGDFIDGTEGYDCQTWNRIEIGDIIDNAPTIIEADKAESEE